MFDQNSVILVVLPTTTEYADWPSANWMVYGDRHGPCARYDVVTLKKDSHTVGSFVFHPSDGGLLWDGNDNPFQVVTNDSFLYHNGEPIAAVKTGAHHSFVMILAKGVTVQWWGDFYLDHHSDSWKEALSQYGDELYE